MIYKIFLKQHKIFYKKRNNVNYKIKLNRLYFKKVLGKEYLYVQGNAPRNILMSSYSKVGRFFLFKKGGISGIKSNLSF